MAEEKKKLDLVAILEIILRLITAVLPFLHASPSVAKDKHGRRSTDEV